MKHLFIAILIICFSTTAFAQNFKLLKAGVEFTPTEDFHYMTNAVAVKVITKLRLCQDECKIKTEEIAALKEVEIRHLQATLANQKLMYTQIIDEKDRTIRQIEEVTLAKISENGTGWLKITLAIVGGTVLGAGIAIGVVYARK